MMNFKIFTLFPELFPGALSASITGNALKENLFNLETINIRNYATDLRKTVDDIPYGGGAGMVLKADVLAEAIDKNLQKKKLKIIYLSPRGKLFTQKMAQEFSNESEIAIICGRFEGIDQRVLNEYEIEEISIGDYVLSGGELAAYVMIDAIVRNISGVLGDEESLKEESFGGKKSSEYDFLLEYPHYTRPQKWRNHEVPEILTSGHHKNIKDWRLQQAVEITKERRTDLYQQYLNYLKKS